MSFQGGIPFFSNFSCFRMNRCNHFKRFWSAVNKGGSIYGSEWSEMNAFLAISSKADALSTLYWTYLQVCALLFITCLNCWAEEARTLARLALVARKTNTFSDIASPPPQISRFYSCLRFNFVASPMLHRKTANVSNHTANSFVLCMFCACELKQVRPFHQSWASKIVRQTLSFCLTFFYV